MTILYVLAFVALLAVLLERTHRRTSGLPRSALGRPGDRDLERVLEDLRHVAEARDGQRPPRVRRTGPAPAVCRPAAS